jgi:hypothetical protein
VLQHRDAAMTTRAIGDYIVGDDDGPKQRGYTTRGKVEQQRTAAPVFTGRVRRWEKRWAMQGHLRVLKWERTAEDSGGPSSTAAAQLEAEGGEEASRAKRARQG